MSMSERGFGLSFLVSPVLGLMEAFSDLKRNSSLKILFWFCLCFGISFSVGTERTKGSTDGISMRADFEKYNDDTEAEFMTHFEKFLEFDGSEQSFYIVTVSYLVGRFTDNYHIFFLVLALVFAFFQLKCLKYFVRERNYTNSVVCILLVCLFLWNNIYNINSARFWTASWFALLCAFKTFIDNKRGYIALSIFTVFFHISFFVFPLVLLLAYLLKNSDKPLLVIFCVSWLFSVFAEDLQVGFFKELNLPFMIQKKVDAYMEGEYSWKNEKGSGFYWVQQLFRTVLRHFIDILILLIALNRKNVKRKRVRAMIGLMLILATVANFGMLMPEFGRRFFIVNYALVAYTFLVSFGDRKYQMLVYMLPFVWFMNLFYLAKDLIYVLDLGFLLPPFVSFVRFALA